MSTYTPGEVVEAACKAGAKKLSLHDQPLRMLILTLLAGAYIAFGGTLSVVIGYGVPELSAANPAVQKLLSGAAFPVGLILVVVLGAELFTGNNALLMPNLMCGNCSWGCVVKNWIVVWCGNFVGSLLFVVGLVWGVGLFGAEPYHSAIVRIAEAKVSMSWLTVFLKGIGANWCVCLAIWLALSAKSSGAKMFGCWLPVMAFVALGYEHCIANMFFIPCGMLEGAQVSIGAMFVDNLVPATLGNIVGGAVFVGCVHTYLYKPKQ